MPPKRPLTDDPSSHQAIRPPPGIPPLSFTKARACEACRKHKIKCEWTPGQRSCTKCERTGLDCVVKDGTQRFIEEDTAWKNDAQLQIRELQAAVSHLLQVNRLHELKSYRPDQISAEAQIPSFKELPISGPSPPIVVPSIDMTRENSQEPQPEQGDIVPAPMKSLYDLTRLNALDSHGSGVSKRPLMDDDFISRGVLSVGEADELFTFYVQNMNMYLWAGILLQHTDLLSVRRSSSMLCAVVVAVASIHKPNVPKETVNKCYSEFVTLVCSNALSRHHSLDDLRALSLGAFYLPTLSWKLSGQAVRIATEMNLHRSFQGSAKAQSRLPSDSERARLWCALYVCDCQFSIAYGRPPVTIEDSTIVNYERVLNSSGEVLGDIRLCAQISLFRTMTDAYQRFGTDMDQVLLDEDFVYLRKFNFAVEEWRLEWEKRSGDNPQVGSYPSKIVVLYYYFAKFQLNSLAFRGIASLPTLSMSIERKEATNSAIAAAISTISVLIEEPALKNALTSVPVFTHTMIAYSATFLLQVAARWSNSNVITIDVRHVLGHVTSTVRLLDQAKMSVGENHLMRHIARGLQNLLDNFRILDSSHSITPTQTFPTSSVRDDVPGAADFARQPTVYNNPLDSLGGNYYGDGNGSLAPDSWPWMMNDVRGTYGFGFDDQLLNPFGSDDSSWFQ